VPSQAITVIAFTKVALAWEAYCESLTGDRLAADVASMVVGGKPQPGETFAAKEGKA